MKRDYRPTIRGEVRTTGEDGLVTRRPAWDGGIRIVVSRLRDGIYYPTHQRRVVRDANGRLHFAPEGTEQP